MSDKVKNLIKEVKVQKAILFVKVVEENDPKKRFLESLQENISAVSMDIDGGDVVQEMDHYGYYAKQVQYNPASLTLTTASKVEETDEAAGTDTEYSNNLSTNAQTELSFDLIFEAVSILDNKDYVKNKAEGIANLMNVAKTRKVGFYYGSQLFKGELTSVSITYTMFDIHGNPVWAVVSVTITETEDTDETGTSNGAGSVMSSSVATDAKNTGSTGKTADSQFDSLAEEYKDYKQPMVVVKINNMNFSENKSNLDFTDVEVELSCGYEASMAAISIINGFDKEKGCFRTQDLKKYIFLGSSVSISMGYDTVAKNIFRGFIAKVNFISEEDEMPYVQITCMDVKGIMMSGSYAKQLSATTYSDAVDELFKKSVYEKMRSKEIFTELAISQTPDKQHASSSQNENDQSIEMVNESDYEFVVRAAKKFNYEFFVDSGIVIFRKAKSAKNPIMELTLKKGLKRFDICYDITGLVESIQVRGMDTSKIKLIKSKQKYNEKISMGNKAKQLLKKSERIYIDATAKSQQDTQYRSEYLLDDMSYRFGTLECECIGMPELKPGNYIKISGIGEPADNEFYICTAKHIRDSEGKYITKIMAKAASIK